MHTVPQFMIGCDDITEVTCVRLNHDVLDVFSTGAA